MRVYGLPIKVEYTPMCSITAHTIVRNDERFIGFAIRSVIAHVECVMVFDTGSTDGTVAVVRALAKEYPGKILLEEKGASDESRHTQLRQEMLLRTKTEWVLILDGDEIWTNRGVTEALEAIRSREGVEFVLAPYYNCVGDIFHDYVRQGAFRTLGRSVRVAPRLLRVSDRLRWEGQYGHDTLMYGNQRAEFDAANSVVLTQKFWHLTHLQRSSSDAGVYSSGGDRNDKRRPTWLGIGKAIKEPVPEVFDVEFQRANKMGIIKSSMNALAFAVSRVRRSLGSSRPLGSARDT